VSTIRIQVRSDRLRAAIARAPLLAATAFRQATTQAGLGFRARMIEGRMSGPPGINAGTGELRKSLNAVPFQGDDVFGCKVGFYGPQGKPARIHEYGGTIRANGNASACGKGKYLAIPLPAAKTGNGRVRRNPCEFGEYDAKKNPTGLLLIKSKKGNLLLVSVGKAKGAPKTRLAKGIRKNVTKAHAAALEKKQSAQTITPLFVLKTSVTIPPRLGFVAEFRAFLPTINAFLKRAVQQVLAGMKGAG